MASAVKKLSVSAATTSPASAMLDGLPPDDAGATKALELHALADGGTNYTNKGAPNLLVAVGMKVHSDINSQTGPGDLLVNNLGATAPLVAAACDVDPGNISTPTWVFPGCMLMARVLL